jgi:hypothetical protein
LKIPEMVKVGGFDWSVKRDENVAIEGNCFGSTHYKTQTIFIEPSSTQQKAEQCLLHELIHVVFWQSGINQRIDKVDNKLEEEITVALAHGLYQVLKDNNLDFSRSK